MTWLVLKACQTARQASSATLPPALLEVTSASSSSSNTTRNFQTVITSSHLSVQHVVCAHALCQLLPCRQPYGANGGELSHAPHVTHLNA
jgi:hypothetical protein